MSETLLTKALAACETLVAREAAYDEANDLMEKLGPEFSWRVRAVDDDIRSTLVDILDEVFALFGGCPADDPHVGGEASYFINECRGGRVPHEVSWKDKEFRLASAEDLRAWLKWQRENPAEDDPSKEVDKA